MNLGGVCFLAVDVASQRGLRHRQLFGIKELQSRAAEHGVSGVARQPLERRRYPGNRGVAIEPRNGIGDTLGDQAVELLTFGQGVVSLSPVGLVTEHVDQLFARLGDSKIVEAQLTALDLLLVLVVVQEQRLTGRERVDEQIESAVQPVPGHDVEQAHPDELLARETGVFAGSSVRLPADEVDDVAEFVGNGFEKEERVEKVREHRVEPFLAGLGSIARADELVDVTSTPDRSAGTAIGIGEGGADDRHPAVAAGFRAQSNGWRIPSGDVRHDVTGTQGLPRRGVRHPVIGMHEGLDVHADEVFRCPADGAGEGRRHPDQPAMPVRAVDGVMGIVGDQAVEVLVGERIALAKCDAAQGIELYQPTARSRFGRFRHEPMLVG